MSNPSSKNPAETKTFSIFDSKAYENMMTGIKVSPFMKMKQIPSLEDLPLLVDLSISERKSCSFCNVDFHNQAQQRQHYKLDWHRYNLKQNLKQRKPISEERFAQLADVDDVSSISGSETETEDESEMSSTAEGEDDDLRLSHLIARRTRLIFQNEEGRVLSYFRCLFTGKKDETPSETELVSAVRQLPNLSQMMIVMLGGGHFAASIFKGTEPVLHKTFHSYTVRAKQGGAQSTKDNKRATGPKSAGASLRRYNEQSLLQHVQDILTSWSKDIADCHLLFYRAVGPGNRSILFGGKQPPLDKNDARLRTLPFPTRRATFSETQRVHSLLTTINIYESEASFSSQFCCTTPKKEEPKSDGLTPEKCKPGRANKKTIDRAKSRVSPQRPLPDVVAQLAIESDAEYDESLVFEIQDQEISFVDTLQEHETNPGEEEAAKRKRRKKIKKEVKPEFSKSAINFRRKVYSACYDGSLEGLETTLKDDREGLTSEEVESAFNQTTPDGVTILQLAAKNAQKEIVRLILLNGGDPCAKDKKSMTAYDFAPDKDTRNVFRRFMGDFPDRHDYTKSHIPSALTDTLEQEMAERKKAAKKVKRQKEKERKIADAPRKQEIAEQKRYLELSDREKRALAAERRILSSLGKAAKNVVLVRCFQCAENMTGKVPFEYETNVFCSMDCLKAHRLSKKSAL